MPIIALLKNKRGGAILYILIALVIFFLAIMIAVYLIGTGNNSTDEYSEDWPAYPEAEPAKEPIYYGLLEVEGTESCSMSDSGIKMKITFENPADKTGTVGYSDYDYWCKYTKGTAPSYITQQAQFKGKFTTRAGITSISPNKISSRIESESYLYFTEDYYSDLMIKNCNGPAPHNIASNILTDIFMNVYGNGKTEFVSDKNNLGERFNLNRQFSASQCSISYKGYFTFDNKDTAVEIPSYVWPVASNVVTSCYGCRCLDPSSGSVENARDKTCKQQITCKEGQLYDLHDGIDIRASNGTEVKSISPGKVTLAEFQKGYGNTMVVQSGDLQIRYSHLSQFKKKVGDTVTQREIIALSGNTGIGTAAHLDMRIRKAGEYIPPLSVFNKDQYTVQPGLSCS